MQQVTRENVTSKPSLPV